MGNNFFFNIEINLGFVYIFVNCKKNKVWYGIFFFLLNYCNCILLILRILEM